MDLQIIHDDEEYIPVSAAARELGISVEELHQCSRPGDWISTGEKEGGPQYGNFKEHLIGRRSIEEIREAMQGLEDFPLLDMTGDDE